MSKQLFIAILMFATSILGNLIANWVQISAETFLGPHRLVGTAIGVLIALVITVLLENERGLSFNWRWHRYWYFKELTKYPSLYQNKEYARLELIKGKKGKVSLELLVNGVRLDLINVVLKILAGKAGPFCRVLILGEPGSGKTTALEQLNFELARSGIKKLGFGHKIPVLVSLANFQEEDLLSYLKNVTKNKVKGQSGKVIANGIEELIESGSVILLLDALDEALGQRREKLLAILRDFFESQRYKHVPLVLTVRTRQDPSGWLRNIDCYEIVELNDDAISVFVRVYKHPAISEGEIIDRLDLNYMLQSGAIGRNPFWLRNIIEYDVFQPSKGLILREIINKLLNRELNKPETQRSWNIVLPISEQLEETKLGLAWLGYHMLFESNSEFDYSHALEILHQWLKNRIGVHEKLRPQDIIELGRDAQILLYESDTIRFQHRLIEEFMAAYALLKHKLIQEPASLDHCLISSDWWETFLLRASLSIGSYEFNDLYQLIEKIIGDGSISNRILLAVSMLWSIKNPDKHYVQLATEKFINVLREGVTEEHKQSAVLLENLAGDKFLISLKELLYLDEKTVQKSVLDILAGIGKENAVRLLIDCLEKRILTTYTKRLLINLGDKAIKLLIFSIQDIKNKSRPLMISTLGEIGGDDAKNFLLFCLGDDNPNVRLASVVGVAKYENSVIEQLLYLLSNGDKNSKIAAIQALGKIGNSIAVDPLIQIFNNREFDIETRKASVSALGKIGDIKAVESLKNALGDKEIRITVIVALGMIADDCSIECLGDVLSIYPDSRPKVENILVKIGGKAVRTLVKILYEQSTEVKTIVERILILNGEPIIEPFIKYLTEYLITKNYPIESRFDVSVITLKKMGELAVKQLIILLNTEKEEIRETSAEILKKMGEMAILPLLITLVEDGIVNIKLIANILIEIGKPTEKYIIFILDNLYNLNNGIQSILEEDAFIEPLKNRLEKFKSKSTALQVIIDVIGEVGNAETAELLIRALDDPEPNIRKTTARSLGKLSNNQAVGPLAIALNDSESFVRQEAAKSLGKLAKKEAVEPLIIALKDVDQYVRRDAADALGYIIDERALFPLINLLSDKNLEVRTSAINTLGKFKDDRVIEPLIDVLKKGNSVIRQSIYNILDKFEESTIPYYDRIQKDLKIEEEIRSEVIMKIVLLQSRIDPTSSIKQLDFILSTNNKELVQQTIMGILNLGQSALPILDNRIINSNSDTRRLIINTLAEIGRPGLDILGAYVRNPNISVRNDVITVLGLTRNPVVSKSLIEALNDSFCMTRYSAYIALGQLGDWKLLGIIKDFRSRETNCVVISAADWAIKEIMRKTIGHGLN